ncbi:hypothetical protein [Fusobacterium sp.]|uniref:hypothetical protein n=1 Tax=Fusobacterium sp. TaxID=68766 RepID=UPI002905234D|nr:hypothetical protein [Fusobacterium sp.]MDU1912485.1 hypothetical protein [Fusobacterium sp.]
MEIKINKSQNKIEIIKDDSIKYAKISKFTNTLFFLSVIVFLIISKMYGKLGILGFLTFLLGATFIIYRNSLYFKNRHINEVLKIDLENIKLEFLKDGDAIYSKDIPRWKVMKIKKEIPPFKFYGKNRFLNIMEEELVDKRILKIITKDEVFSWGYKIEEEKIDEIIKLIKEFWNIED